jgi:hypothetical protein
VEGKGFVFLFTKYTGGRELYWKTSGEGFSWGEDRKLAGIQGHYQVSGEFQGKVATFFNFHPDYKVDLRTNLYFAQTTDLGRTWTTAGGQPLDMPLTTPQNPALVRDLQARGLLMYTCDLNFDPAGNPALLYITSGTHVPGPGGGPREWNLSRWTGADWEHQVLTTSTHNYDMGSLYIEGEVWRVIAPTVAGPQKLGGGGEMALWVSRDSGRTWALERQITRGSRYNHNYARRPVRAKDPFYAFWADGDPTGFSPSSLYFTDSTGTRVWRLPYDVEGETARPEPVDFPGGN